MEDHNQHTIEETGQPEYVAMHHMLDAWLDEWGVKELFDLLGEPTLQKDEYQQHWQTIQEHIATALEIGIQELTPQTVRPRLQEKLATYVTNNNLAYNAEQQATMLDLLINELFGFSVLEPLLSDPHVTNIQVDAPQDIWVLGRRISNTFHSMGTLLRTIRRLVVLQGGWLDQRSPIGMFRMEDTWGYISLPPVAIHSPNITISKIPKDYIEMDHLIQSKSVSPDLADFLKACMQTDLSIVVAGGTASGKTTFLNILTGFIPEQQRIVKIEKVSSIQLRRTQHTVSLERRPPDSNGRGEVTIFDLLILAKGMVPERMIVGELEGPEVLMVLQLMEQGYPLLTLMHADNHENALYRLEMLVKFHNPELPTPHLRAFIGSAVDIIIQTNRLPDGSRKVTSVVEVQSLRTGDYTVNPIFTFQQTGINEQGKIEGDFRSNKMSKALSQRFQAYNIFLPGLMPSDDEF